MTGQSVRALGVASLHVNNPDPHRRTPQLMIDTGEGVAWRLLRDLHSLFLSPSGQTLLELVPLNLEGADGADENRYVPREEERLVLIDVADGVVEAA